jgi:hypothetical protein
MQGIAEFDVFSTNGIFTTIGDTGVGGFSGDGGLAVECTNGITEQHCARWLRQHLLPRLKMTDVYTKRST